MGSFRSLFGFAEPEPVPEVDIVAVLAAEDPDPDVVHLFDHTMGHPVVGPQPARLLAADAVALVRWWRYPHLYCYDGAGRCLAVARWHWRDGISRSSDVVLTFKDRHGPSFRLETWESQITTVFTGRTAATVTTYEGELIGTYHQRGNGALHDASGAQIGSSHWEKLGPRRRQLTLRDPDGLVFARYWHRGSPPPWARTSRRTDFYSVVEFSPRTPPELRALTLAGELCAEMQARKDLDIG